MLLSQLDNTTTTSRSAWFTRYFQPIFQKSIRKLRRLKTEGITVTGFGDFRRWALASRSPSPVTKIKLTNPEQRRKWQKPNKFAMLDKNRLRKDKNTGRIYEARIKKYNGVAKRMNLFELFMSTRERKENKELSTHPCLLSDYSEKRRRNQKQENNYSGKRRRDMNLSN